MSVYVLNQISINYALDLALLIDALIEKHSINSEDIIEQRERDGCTIFVRSLARKDLGNMLGIKKKTTDLIHDV